MPENIQLEDYISGGYFLTKIISRPQVLPALIPDRVLTISACFTDVAPDLWADSGYTFEERERAEAASKFGIPSSAVGALIAEFSEAARKDGWSNAFADLSIARRFFEASTTGDQIAIIGIGLNQSVLPELQSQLNDDVNKGAGLIERVNRCTQLATNGRALGYEPLGFEAMKFHSWLCHNEPSNADKQFGIRPNVDGFIDNLADAERVTRNLKAMGAEPAIWLPWLLVRYNPEVS